MSASAAKQPWSTDEREPISERVKVLKEGQKVRFQFVSKQFRDSDADVTIVSSDDVRFELHKKNLALYTGGFPPLEFGTSSRHEEATLSERAIILDLLFRFVYQQSQPDLEDVEVSVVSELADVAAKYQVYNAITVCKVVMRYEMQNHPLEVFVYAARHNYLDLIDKAAPLVLGMPFHTIVDKVPATVLAAWFRYLAEWDIPRLKWTGEIVTSLAAKGIEHSSKRGSYIEPSSCSENCQSLAFLLQLTKSMLPEEKLLDLARADVCAHCNSTYLKSLRREVPTQFSNFPKFRTFLHPEGAN